MKYFQKNFIIFYSISVSAGAQQVVTSKFLIMSIFIVHVATQNFILFSDTSLIKQPNITTVGSADNCTILIQHNTSVTCVRNITYCLNTNNMEPECNVSSNLDDLMLEYPLNATFTNLSIVYDIIYAKYLFDINITQCANEGKRYS